MTVKVELGFTSDGSGGPFLTLDDPILGRLDEPTNFLGGGEVFVDVSEFLQNYSLQRGASRELDRYQAGQITVQFQNNTRVFDPTFEASPYFGQIVPKRNIRVTQDSIIQFFGVVEDWNISYSPNGNSVAVVQGFDAFSFLTNITFTDTELVEEDVPVRLNKVLDVISWSDTARQIEDSGGATLAAQSVIEPLGVLDYLTQAAHSDPGDLFIAKNGDIKFAGRNATFTSAGAVFSDAGDGIPYKNILAIFGSELLYNSALVTSSAGSERATNTTSVQIYGQRDLEQVTLLSSAEQLEELAKFFVTRYANPEFRFEAITVDLNAVSSEQRALLLAIELADVVKVEFTPNGIAPAIERYGKVIGIAANITPQSQEVTYKLQTTEGALFVLGDAVFGRLDEGNLLGW